jgi:voltage-gated potassium channel Kch
VIANVERVANLFLTKTTYATLLAIVVGITQVAYPLLPRHLTIVGGGQSGSAFAFALRRAGVGRVSVIDAAEDEAQAGVWLTAARMNVLRTAKTLPGPELGIPALSFQSWYEARNGIEAYAAMERIPRASWAEYLSWYRHFLAIPIRYRTRLVRIEPADGHFRLHLDVAGVAKVETVRKVILANGVAGNGGLPCRGAGEALWRLCHTADASFRGIAESSPSSCRVGVRRGAVALGRAWHPVHLFCRRPTPRRPVSHSAISRAYDNYPELPDAVRARAVRFPERSSTARCAGR